jgi:hypothetical protein
VLDAAKSRELDCGGMNITKAQAKKLLEVETDADLARFFEIGRWAVGQWPENEPMPELRQLQLRARRPDLFTKKAA